MENSVTDKGSKTTNVMRLHLVYYLPSLTTQLLSMGQILQGNTRLQGDTKSLVFLKESDQKLLEAFPLLPKQTIYWANSKVIPDKDLIKHTSMYADDFDLWHQRLGHPSDQVLDRFQKDHEFSFKKPVQIPLCKGCAKGKMHSHKWFISFLDDFTSYAWITLLRRKVMPIRLVWIS